MSPSTVRYTPHRHAADGLILAGTIVSPHGIRGEVKLQCYLDPAPTLGSQLNLLEHNGQNTHHLTITARAKKHTLIVKIRGTTTRTHAEALRGLQLFIPRTTLPPPAQDNEFYIEDLLGLQVRSTAGQTLGTVAAVLAPPGGHVIEILTPAGEVQHHLFSYDNFPEVHPEQGYIILDQDAE